MKNINFLLLAFLIVFASCHKTEVLIEEIEPLNVEETAEAGKTYPYSIEISRSKIDAPIHISFSENPNYLDKYGDLISMNWAVMESNGDLMTLENYENIHDFNLWEYSKESNSQASKVDIVLTTIYENSTLEYSFCLNKEGAFAEFGDCNDIETVYRDFDPDGNTFTLILPVKGS